jgi:uncharacterized membrane protein
MEMLPFAALAFLLVVVSPIGAVILALRVWDLSRRLERRVDDVESALLELRRGRPAGTAEQAKAERVSPPEATTPKRGATTQGPAPSPAIPRPPREVSSAAPHGAPTRAGTRAVARQLEEQLGAHLPIWIGAVALALAGVFLVKLSLDRGWLLPATRVALGLLFGLSLLACGEWLRRRSTRVAAGLAAAGIAVLFAALFAGVNLYGLISPAVGLLLMGLTTAAAVGLSLRHGFLMAALGLVGGFLSPYLVRLEDPDLRPLLLYLLLLQAGLLAVGRRRGWWQLTLVAFLAGLGWVALSLGGPLTPEHATWLGAFVVTSVALPVGAMLRAGRAGTAPAFERNALTLHALATTGGLAALASLTLQADHSRTTWLFVAIIGLGTMLVERLRPRFHGLAWIAVSVPALLAVHWLLGLDGQPHPHVLGAVALVGALFAVVAYLCQWRSPDVAGWAWLSAASGVVYLLLAYRGATGLELSLPWGAICIAMAGLYLAAALPVSRRRETVGFEGALGALAAAATTFVSLAVPIELERQWLTVAWALEASILVWLAGRLRVPILRTLACVLAGGVGIRLLANPDLLRYAVGTHPIFNWLTYGYGIPVASFVAAASIAQRRGDSKLAEVFRAGAIVLGVAGLTLLVRQAFHPGNIGSSSYPLGEWGTISVVWLAAAWALLRAHRARPFASFAGLGRGIAVLALLQVTLAQCLLANPLWHHTAVGSLPILNTLLLAYGAPAALLLLLARERSSPAWLRAGCRLGALLTTFLLVTLELRQAFQGTHLDTGTASNAEQWAYSISWIGLGLALLAFGILGRSQLARFASLALMFLAVGKVFLYDMAALQDFYRILSFLGLGASLMLLAGLYQRFVFRAETDGHASS